MKIMLADDHPIFLEGLKNLLTIRDMDVVATVRDGLEAFEKARELSPDVILMDVAMPRLDGLAATRLIKAEMPHIKVVMLTMSETDEDLFEAIKSGACGYLLKSEDTDTFFKLFFGLMDGETPLSLGLASRVFEEFSRNTASRDPFENVENPESPPLTPRQIQVLTLVAQGLTYKEIGTILFLSERTIKYHMGEIVQRLHLENRRQAIAYAKTAHIVGANPSK
jgi:DNA-binding NarL/FixJ family response regulator